MFSVKVEKWKWCVYTHTVGDTGIPFYVGMGRLSRALAVEGNARSAAWRRCVSAISYYRVNFVLFTNDKAEALAHERRLIAELKPSCNVNGIPGRPPPRVRPVMGGGRVPRSDALFDKSLPPEERERLWLAHKEKQRR